MDIVLVDSTRPLKKEFVLPAGRLREPRSALRRAHLVVFTRTEQSKLPSDTISRSSPLAVYLANSKLLGFRKHGADNYRHALRPSLVGPYFAFCGIGNPDAFFADLQRWGLHLVGRRAFRDHHRYSFSEIEALQLGGRGPSGGKPLPLPPMEIPRAPFSAEQFFRGMFETALAPGELITAVRFPLPIAAGHAKMPNAASRFALVGVFVAKGSCISECLAVPRWARRVSLRSSAASAA